MNLIPYVVVGVLWLIYLMIERYHAVRSNEGMGQFYSLLDIVVLSIFWPVMVFSFLVRFFK